MLCYKELLVNLRHLISASQFSICYNPEFLWKIMYNYPMAEKMQLDSSTQAGREKSTQLATTRISYLCTSSRQRCQCLPSFLLMKPRMDSSHQTSTTSSLKQDLRKVNFSNVFQGNSTTVLLLPTNNNTVAKAAAVAATYCSSTSNGSSPKPVSFVPRNQETPPDEQSETVGHNSHGSHAQYHEQTSKSAGRKAEFNNYYDEPLLESESSSLNLCSRKHDYTSDNYEEPEGAVKDNKLAREGTGVKRRRNAKIHNLNERKRRDKINKKMRILKELIPNCNKMDKASMLDDAIEYLKTLKFQLQIMSMGLCMPLMMLPQLMGAGMGLRPDTGGGIPCSLPQYPIAPFPVINGNGGVPMFGFPNQVPPMPISRAPLDHSYGWKSFYTTTFGN